MKPAILQCLQQFYSKNSKKVYHDQILKNLKLQCHCKLLFCSVCSSFPVKTAKTFIMTKF